MKPLMILMLVVFMAIGCSTTKTYRGSNKDRDLLEKTSVALRAAFADGDIATIIAYHHPDVIKSLSPDKYLKNRDAVEADLIGTFKVFKVEFLENREESLLFQGETAVQSNLFVIKATPKNGGDPLLFKGRALVVYVRYKKSPTGWASIREVIQDFQ